MLIKKNNVDFTIESFYNLYSYLDLIKIQKKKNNYILTLNPCFFLLM